jgi:hypothetical protein
MTKGYMNKLSKSVFPTVRLEISPQRRVWLTTRAEERRGDARPLISGNCPIWVYFRLAILTRLDKEIRRDSVAWNRPGYHLPIKLEKLDLHTKSHCEA